MRFSATLVIVLLSLPSISFPAVAGEDLGVVLMHGKWGTPDRGIPELASALEWAGIRVETPEMPWSESRHYDKDYEEAMNEIDAAVEKLKERGAKRIVVGGHSMGGNAAVGYAARRDGLAGVIVLAPGHFPGRDTFHKQMGWSYEKAKAMVEAGKGEEAGKFVDVNQGMTENSFAKARVFLSYFDPDGPAVWTNNAPKINPEVPLLLVVGTRDEYAPRVLYRGTRHPKDDVVIVDAGHSSTPDRGTDAVKLWLRALQCEKPWCGKPNPSFKGPTTLKGFGRLDCTLEQLIKSECE